MSFPYSFYCNVELDQEFNSCPATTLHVPMCNEIAKKINAKIEKIDGGICFITNQGGKWKYRSVEKHGKHYVYFAPSRMRGVGRNFDLDECREKFLKEYEGFFVGDIFAPNSDESKKIVPVYQVRTSDLLECILQSDDGFLEFVR